MQAARTQYTSPAPEPTVIEDALFKCTPVFLQNYQSTATVVVNQGGTSSGKTYSIMQVLFMKAAYEPGVIITVCGEDGPALKKGAYRDAETIYNKSVFLKAKVRDWNKSDKVIIFHNGSKIEFSSYDGITDASSGKRDYLFVNEANSISYEIYWQLFIRTRKRTFIDYNPTTKFWVHAEVIGNEGVELWISDHRHNPYLSETEHQKIEGIKNKSRWRVYARGLTGNVHGLIYADWQRIDEKQFPEEAFQESGFGGADFGYTIDETAIVKVVRQGDKIFVKEVCYETGIPAQRVKSELELANFTGKHRLYCEQDPDMINQLRRVGVMAFPARKGPGSIKAGILKLQEFKVFYCGNNIHEEVTKYMWEKDKLTDKFINEPVDKYNHLMDAIRYAVYTHFFRQPN